jgi:membrane protein
MGLRALWHTPKRAIWNLFADDGFTLAAALAFYAILSLAPLLVLAVTVLGFLGESTQQRITTHAESLIGPEAASGVEALLKSARAQRVGASISAAIGLVFLLLSSTGAFAQLQYSLNRIFNVRTRRSMVKGWLYKRAMSLLMVFAIGIVIVGSLVVNSIIASVFRASGATAELISLLTSFAVFTLIFIIMFRVLPDVKITWTDTWVGGVISGILFIAGEYGISRYLAYSSTSSVYGAAGSLVILLLWIYYSSLILFLGAELTQAYAQCCGTEIVPNEFAEWDPEARKAHETPPPSAPARAETKP